jgi:hypothetical protein
MSCVHKYNTLLNQAKKLCTKKNKDKAKISLSDDNDIYDDIADKLFTIYKEIDYLRDKESKKYKDSLLDNSKLSDLLDNIIGDSEVLMVTKSKKLKKELLLALLDDIMEYIENNELLGNNGNIIFINDEYNEYNISLPKFTKFIFGSKKSLFCEKPAIYKCPGENMAKIKNVISEMEKPDTLDFNINEITNDIHVRDEFDKMVIAFHS